MTINFQYALDDYRNGFRAHYRKGASAYVRWMLKLAIALGVILLFSGILMASGPAGFDFMAHPLCSWGVMDMDWDGRLLSAFR